MQAAEVIALVAASGELALERLVIEPDGLIIVARARGTAAIYAACGHRSQRAQSRYERVLAGLPWHGRAVVLRLRVRRFVCRVPGCPGRIFCERLAATTAAHAQRMTRSWADVELIGTALGGEAGTRLASTLGLAGGSADALLRLLKQGPAAPASEAAATKVRCSASMIGRGGEAGDTAPSSPLLGGAACSIYSRTGSLPPSPPHSRRTRAWRSSAATGQVPTRTERPAACLRRSRSPTAFTSYGTTRRPCSRCWSAMRGSSGAP